jgi:hypothetical protein
LEGLIIVLEDCLDLTTEVTDGKAQGAQSFLFRAKMQRVDTFNIAFKEACHGGLVEPLSVNKSSTGYP